MKLKKICPPNQQLNMTLLSSSYSLWLRVQYVRRKSKLSVRGLSELSKRFPEDFNDLMDTFQLSEDVLRDISAISRLSVTDKTTAKKVTLSLKIAGKKVTLG